MTKQRKQKSLRELTIKDNFMFGAVMTDEINCKTCLELVLGKTIEKLTVCREKSIIYHPDYKGVRLDVIAKDEAHTHYDVEMQVVAKPALGKRARYYHSQLDMEMLEVGHEYRDLAHVYVIFICDYDPFGDGLYRYDWEMECKQNPELNLDDGVHTIILSTQGRNDEAVPEELVKFLKYVGADLDGSKLDYADAYVSRLQDTVASIKSKQEVEASYMLWTEFIREEREDAREEGVIAERFSMILEILADITCEIPEDLKQSLQEIDDPSILKECFRKARKVTSIQEFREWMQNI